jgi:membrane dipeptidase
MLRQEPDVERSFEKSHSNLSRRSFLTASARARGVILLPPAWLKAPGWTADHMDPRVGDIVGQTIGIDTHNHIDVPFTEAEMPGPGQTVPSAG